MKLASAERPSLCAAVAHLVLSVVLVLPHFPRSHRGCRCPPTVFLASLTGELWAMGGDVREVDMATVIPHTRQRSCAGTMEWCIALRPRRQPPVSMRSSFFSAFCFGAVVSTNAVNLMLLTFP